MLLDIIFIHKEENNNIDLFKRNFQSQIKFDDKYLCLGELRFSYSIQKSEAQREIRLKVSTLDGKSTKKEADNITALKNKLSKGKHRSEYHIVFIFDGASEYYCSKLSRFMSIFERKLRQFIYLNVLDIYGKDWVKETLTDEIQTEVNKKQKNKNRHIEMALDCFTFQDYISYLFAKRSNENPYDVIREAISALEAGNNPDTQIINILKKGEQVSLWDKLFYGFDISFNENEIDGIRNIRNDVMHNKEISDLEFTEYKKLLRSSIKKLDEGIFNAERQKYSPIVDIVDVLYSLSETMQSMRKMSESLAESISPAITEIQKMAQKLAESIAEIPPLNTKALSSITALQRSVVLPNFDLYKNISFPVLENTKHLNLGIGDQLKSIQCDAFKPLNLNFLQRSRLEFPELIDNGDEFSKNVEDLDNAEDGE